MNIQDTINELQLESVELPRILNQRVKTIIDLQKKVELAQKEVESDDNDENKAKLEEINDYLNEYFTDAVEQLKSFAKKHTEKMKKEAELKEIVQLVGPDALPEDDKLILDTTKSLREDYLQQNAFHEVDTYCNIKKQNIMLKTILTLHKLGLEAVSKGVKVSDISALSVKEKIARMKYTKDIEKESVDITKEIGEEIKKFNGNIAVFEDFEKGLTHLQHTFGLNILNDKI